MKNKILVFGVFMLPNFSFSQSAADALAEWADGLRGLQTNIAKIGADQMGNFQGILSSITVILSIGLIFYLFARIYRALLAAEPIDWWGMLKPAKVLALIVIYPLLVNLLGAALAPIKGATAGMNIESHERMIAARQAALEQSEDWKMFIGSDGQGDFENYVKKYGTDSSLIGIGDELVDSITFAAEGTWVSIKYAFKAIVSEILRLFYESAILILHFISTFYLIVLVTLGPIPLALSLFPGFENGFTSWMGQYIDKYLWLPIANILATVLNSLQEDMITTSAAANAIGDTGFFSATDFGYFIFMIIGIAAFMCVPSISSMIVSAGSPSSALGNAARGVAAGAVAGTAAGLGGGYAAGKAGYKATPKIKEGYNKLKSRITG